MSERCERTRERTSEWPSTYVSILVCSRPQCVPPPIDVCEASLPRQTWDVHCQLWSGHCSRLNAAAAATDVTAVVCVVVVVVVVVLADDNDMSI